MCSEREEVRKLWAHKWPAEAMEVGAGGSVEKCEEAPSGPEARPASSGGFGRACPGPAVARGAGAGTGTEVTVVPIGEWANGGGGGRKAAEGGGPACSETVGSGKFPGREKSDRSKQRDARSLRVAAAWE